MTQLYISFSEEDTACATTLRQELKEAGYDIWDPPEAFTPEQISYGKARQNGIRGSAAMVLVWSENGAESEWVLSDIANAERLQKPILPVIVDGTTLPTILVNVNAVRAETSCEEATAELQPKLPTPGAQEELEKVIQQLSHDYIRERYAGIEGAVELLEDGKYEQQLLAALEDVSRKDLMVGVQRAAREALDRFQGSEIETAESPESRHIFGVRCANGHISYYDKRQVCRGTTFKREDIRRGDSELSTLVLSCKTDGCDEMPKVEVDCEGYR